MFTNENYLLLIGTKFCTCVPDVMHSPCVCLCADIPQLKSEIEAKQLFVVELPQGNDEDTFRTHGELLY